MKNRKQSKKIHMLYNPKDRKFYNDKIDKVRMSCIRTNIDA